MSTNVVLRELALLQPFPRRQAARKYYIEMRWSNPKISRCYRSAKNKFYMLQNVHDPWPCGRLIKREKTVGRHAAARVSSYIE